MTQMLEILVPVLTAGLVLFFLLLSGTRGRKASGALSNESLDDLRATHYQYFSLIRQALSGADEEYLRRRIDPELARTALRERRNVAKKFLSGLHEDFSKLCRLARMVASLSPSLDRQQEAERLKLTVIFRIVYAIVWARLYAGSIPVSQFERLAGLIGQFADQMEQAMASVNALSNEPMGIISQS